MQVLSVQKHCPIETIVRPTQDKSMRTQVSDTKVLRAARCSTNTPVCKKRVTHVTHLSGIN